MTVTLAERLGAKPPDQKAKFFNFLVYGEPGAGKTVLIGTAADDPILYPVLVADVEGGVASIRKKTSVDVVSIRTMKELENVVNALANDTTKYYKTFAIDSITELEKLDMLEIMKKTALTNTNPKFDPEVPSPREWGKTGLHMREVLRAARDLELHTIVTALEAQETDDATDLTKYFPSIPGKLRGEIAGFFDIVGRLEAKPKQGNIIRTLQTQKTNRVIAKDRFAVLDALVENPTLPEMWAKIAA